MVHFLVKTLTIQKDHHFLDLGCGTGHFAKRIIQESSSEPSIVTGVDFSENMIRQFLKHLPKASGIVSDIESFVTDGALDPVKEENSTLNSALYHRVLLKEVVHHVKDLKTFFMNLKEQLASGGQILIVTRPQDIEFPFFKKALEEFKRTQMSMTSLLKIAKNAGLQGNMQEFNIPIAMDKTRLFRIIKNRFMSNFEPFNDQEIQEGVQELTKKFKDIDTINFNDRLLFVTLI